MSQRKGDKAAKFRQIRSLGVEKKARSVTAERSITEALTSGDVDEREPECRAELCQVLTNIYIELRGGVSWSRKLG